MNKPAKEPSTARALLSKALSPAGLRVVSFISGGLVAFAICAMIGQHLSSSNIFRDFGRFHTRLSPESFFQPTASEVRALAHDLFDKSKVNVVVGGSSVFYGVGQPQGMTIADNLRREL